MYTVDHSSTKSNNIEIIEWNDLISAGLALQYMRYRFSHCGIWACFSLCHAMSPQEIAWAHEPNYRGLGFTSYPSDQPSEKRSEICHETGTQCPITLASWLPRGGSQKLSPNGRAWNHSMNIQTYANCKPHHSLQVMNSVSSHMLIRIWFQ